MAKRKNTKRQDELLDELLGGAKTQDEIFGPEGVIKRLTAVLVERALRAEMSEHLEQENAEGLANRRNGTSEKTLQTDHGPATLRIPRDREARFEPRLVPKHATRVPGLDEKILFLSSSGLSTRDIQARLEELYGTEISGVAHLPGDRRGAGRGLSVAKPGSRQRLHGAVARCAGRENAT